MKNISILEGTDVIQTTDYIRPLSAMCDGMGDTYEINGVSCYGGGPINNLKWAPILWCLGKCWMGRTVGEFANFDENSRTYIYEFARGDIPQEHILKKKERYDSYSRLWGTEYYY